MLADVLAQQSHEGVRKVDRPFTSVFRRDHGRGATPTALHLTAHLKGPREKRHVRDLQPADLAQP
ncbi:hypothetical protein ACQP04_28130 [Pseudonocardia halophobica]|uniref:hypothetical protein n=1 Tax=Pseudonocardia halophobica TaxID=29401 RepID=UPI003D8E1B2A